MEKRILDTLNGALNKQLCDNYIVARRSDGSILSDREIFMLTRPCFSAGVLEEPAESYGIHWDETPVEKQFAATIRMAADETDEVKAARMFVGSIYPMCGAISESQEGESTSLYNADQMISAFVAGKQWLRERCAQYVPRGMTLDGAMELLWKLLVALPKDWSLENAVKFMQEYHKEHPKQ